MKNKFKKISSILATKFTKSVITRMNAGGGTNLPGRIARKIHPLILAELIGQTKKDIIVVTGTNGKTTTAGFISGILNSADNTVAHNKMGANMLPGITCAIIDNASLTGKMDKDYTLLEIDEAYCTKAVDEFAPDLFLVTNLFRDQLDRYGELDTTAKKIREAIEKTAAKKRVKVALNADDPIVSFICKDVDNVDTLFYGFEKIQFLNQESNIAGAKEVAACSCGCKLEYKKIFYGHVGHYNCGCGKHRPDVEVIANATIDINHTDLNIFSEETGEFNVRLNMPGLYNAYNALGAIAVAIDLKISKEKIIEGLNNYNTIFGRAETKLINGKITLIQLIKNPIGATEVLRTVREDKNNKLLIIINDDYADGRDVSWLWDANFELLNKYDKQVVTSGIRAGDMAVRLKYAGISSKNIYIEENIKKAVKHCIDNINEGEKLYILPTYTALLYLQKHYR